MSKTRYAIVNQRDGAEWLVAIFDTKEEAQKHIDNAESLRHLFEPVKMNYKIKVWETTE